MGSSDLQIEGNGVIARLERVRFREAFPSEVRDFSRWLHDNIDELGADKVDLDRR
jgi:hypothetical protein